MTRHVVVGMDGSVGAAAALTWAAEEARLREAELVAWTVLERPATATTPGTAATEMPPSAIEELTRGYPVTVHRSHGDAATELIAACADTDLLVVGSRGRNQLTELLLGSVSRACLAQARCPVVVVRSQQEGVSSHGRVVAGIDMSGHSRQALRVAAEEARLRDAVLDVVHAVRWERSGMEILTPTTEQLVEWGHKRVATELAAAGVTGHPVVVHGRAPEVLVQQSIDADLLVVGSRGQNPVVRLLGSTSEHCARHAHCPVMITHYTETEEQTTGE